MKVRVTDAFWYGEAGTAAHNLEQSETGSSGELSASRFVDIQDAAGAEVEYEQGRHRSAAHHRALHRCLLLRSQVAE